MELLGGNCDRIQEEVIGVVNNSSGGLICVLRHLWYFLKREEFRMVDYKTIAELVSQIPVDTWNLLREIKQRRPAMMLSELIDYSKRVSQAPQRPELGSPTNEPINPG